MTILTCFSDSHGMHKQIVFPKRFDDETNILVIAGDITRHGLNAEQELIGLNKWIGKQRFDHTILVYGNHDGFTQQYPERTRQIMTNCICLCDESVIINNIKFYGTPWSNLFCDWWWMLSEQDLEEQYKQIPDDVDVIISHGPAKGILDMNIQGEHCGSIALHNRVMDINPRMVISGHIHENYGIYEIGHTKFINPSICTLDYKPTNKPIQVYSYE